MKSSVFWALVRKDVYMLRGFMYATLAIGVLSVVLVRFGKIGFAVGGVLFLTANVGSAIFISMYSLLTERKNRSRAFALSLPISGADHDRSKLVSGYTRLRPAVAGADRPRRVRVPRGASRRRAAWWCTR